MERRINLDLKSEIFPAFQKRPTGEENFFSEVRKKKWAKSDEPVTSSATNANSIVAEEEALKKP